ncbi:hypothetical protein Q1695_016293 [Nippostrongylus brasiliensis]|nr:hypothetical protein Q1695_016293 [Nippostrongylus brasiliensis]
MNGFEEKPRNRPLLARAFGMRKEVAARRDFSAEATHSLNQHGFLAVPIKTTIPVDLVKPMTLFFANFQTGSAQTGDVRPAIEAFSRLRSRACCQPTRNLQSLVNSLAEYYDQLTVFEKRFEQTAPQHLEGFKWNDAFENGKSFFGKTQNSVSDIFLERAAVLFNYGAVLSQIAASQSFLTDDETKTAAKLFQQSAGVFAHLRELVQLAAHKNLTNDLNPETLLAISNIMLAQSQEAFYRKAYAEKLNPKALVKVAAQAADFYSEASKTMDLTKNYWKKEWLNTIAGKAFGFQAIAEFHGAQVHWERHEVGERLSRLKHSIDLVEKMKRRLAPSSFREQISEIEHAYKESTSDNRLIYHARIPDYFGLPALPRATLAKAVPVTQPLYPGFKDLFSSVVTSSSMLAMKKFETMKTERLRTEKDRLSEQTELMDGIVASLNVPDVLPEEVKRKSAKVKSAGGISKMRKSLNELTSLQKRNNDILADIDRVLVEENHSDADLRMRLGSDSIRVSSDQVVGPFVQEISKHHADLKHAADMDRKLLSLFEANQNAIDILSRNEKELRAAIPAPPSQLKKQPSESTSALLKLMDRARAIKREREGLLSEINTKFSSSPSADDQNSDFMGINDDDYIQQVVDKICLPVEEMVRASIKKQEYLMCDIESWSARFSIGSHIEGISQRGQVLRSLDVGYEAFEEIHSKLDQEIKAYNEMLTALRRLQKKVKDFSFARQTEKEELLRDHKPARQATKSTVLPSAPSVCLSQVSAPPYPVPSYTAPQFTAASPQPVGVAQPPQPSLQMPTPFLTYQQYPAYAVMQQQPPPPPPSTTAYNYSPAAALCSTAPLISTQQFSGNPTSTWPTQ